MILPFELLWNWGRKKMNIDEQIFKRTDKHWCFELWYENVTQLKKRFRKAAFCDLFFTLF